MAKITFLKTGAVHEIADGSSYLDFCQSNDVPQDFGCTVGSCGTCALVIEEGGDNVNAATEDEKDVVEMCSSDAHARLGCQLTINGDITLRPAEV
tara:strand:- start:829 stop:1113 length:285 start_codon:yes stop_codon:yes gene_type:complete